MGDVLDLPAAEQPIHLIMSDPPASVQQHHSRDVAKELAAEEIGVLVVESPVRSVGIVSERDVVAVMAIGGDVEREQVKTVMSVDLVTAAPTDSIAAVGRLMIDAGVRSVAVRGDDGRIAGVVSLRDVLDALLVGQL